MKYTFGSFPLSTKSFFNYNDLHGIFIRSIIYVPAFSRWGDSSFSPSWAHHWTHHPEQHPLVMLRPWQDWGKGQNGVSSYFSETIWFFLSWGSEHGFICFLYCLCYVLEWLRKHLRTSFVSMQMQTRCPWVRAWPDLSFVWTWNVMYVFGCRTFSHSEAFEDYILHACLFKKCICLLVYLLWYQELNPEPGTCSASAL